MKLILTLETPYSKMTHLPPPPNITFPGDSTLLTDNVSPSKTAELPLYNTSSQTPNLTQTLGTQQELAFKALEGSPST